MTPESRILRDLGAGPSTADSIAPRVRLATAAAEILLRRMEVEKKLESYPLGGVLSQVPVYRLARNYTPEN
jgi:hypothetical protein